MSKVLIIAEAGVNHNGKIELAKQLIDVAAEAGADYVKFQTFKSEELVSEAAEKAEYQIANTGKQAGQLAMLKSLELNEQAHHHLIAYCMERNIKFLSTPFDISSINFLSSLGMELFKISSGEITNLPHLKKIGSLKKKVILSTGMANLEEIKAALDVLTEAGTSIDNIIVLHCTTDYPTAFEDVNLNAMLTIKNAFNVKVGYSDHTMGIEIPIAATSLGAVCIEKHFTLDRNMDGPDHKASLEPVELKQMVESIRNVEKAMGSEIKQPSQSELKNLKVVRKSVHLNKDLPKGHPLVEEDLIMLRPGDGISPMKLYSVIGKPLRMELKKGTKLKWEHLEA